MIVEDFDGTSTIDCDDELLARLRSVRRGSFGAFILSHAADGASLWVHLNGHVAYIHYFPPGARSHAGFQPLDGPFTSTSPDEEIRFVQVDGSEADGFSMAPEFLVPANVAYAVVREFLWNSALPDSIVWQEL